MHAAVYAFGLRMLNNRLDGRKARAACKQNHWTQMILTQKEGAKRTLESQNILFLDRIAAYAKQGISEFPTGHVTDV